MKIFRICFDLFGVLIIVTKFIVDIYNLKNNEKNTIPDYWLLRYYLQYYMLAHLYDTGTTTLFSTKIK
jgi:hypothetical protein